MLVGLFVGLVVIGMLFVWVFPSNTATGGGLSVSALTLISGSASSLSFNKTCAGDTYLEIYVSNSGSSSISLTNASITLYDSPHTQGVVLVPESSGCIPVWESNPTIPPNSDDILIQTYPDVPVPPYTGWNVTILFSNGEKLTQPDLAASPD